MKPYRLRSGDLVTSKDGTWPTQYTNRTQANNAAAKIPGAVVIQRGRPFYVKLFSDDVVCPDGPACPDASCQATREAHGLPVAHADLNEAQITHVQHIFRLTLETWRASGARTEARRDALCHFYAESYFGAAAQWTDGSRAVVATALLWLRQATRIDELSYAPEATS